MKTNFFRYIAQRKLGIFFIFLLGIISGSCGTISDDSATVTPIPTDLRCSMKCSEVNDSQNTYSEFSCSERNDRGKHPCRLVIIYSALDDTSEEDKTFCMGKNRNEPEREACPEGTNTPKKSAPKKPTATQTPVSSPCDFGDPMEKENCIP